MVSQETVLGLLGSSPIPQDWTQLLGVNKIITQPFSLNSHVLSGQLVTHPVRLDCHQNMFHTLINFIQTHYRHKMEDQVSLGLAASTTFTLSQFSTLFNGLFLKQFSMDQSRLSALEVSLHWDQICCSGLFLRA